MKPVLGACERLNELRANWLKGGSVELGKKPKGCSLQGFFFQGFTVKTEKHYV